MQLAAADRVVGIWRNNPTAWIGENGSDLPQSIALPLRQLIVLDLPLERFRQLMALLADRDATWLATASLTRSPHARTIEARFYQAYAAGMPQRVKVLAEATRSCPEKPWVVAERDLLVGIALDLIASGAGNEVGSAQFSMLLLDEGMVLTPWQHLSLAATGVWAIADGLREQGEELADHLRDRIIAARGQLSSLDIEARVNGTKLLTSGLDAMARNVAVYRSLLMGQLNRQFDQVLGQIRRTPSQNLNWTAVNQNLRRIRTSASETEQRVQLVAQYLTEAEHRQLTASLVRDAQDLQRRCGEFTS